jgi:tRNA pseudouridine38-40 synthase
VLPRPDAAAGGPPGAQRIAIGLEYDGSGFCGWQRQEQAASIQGAVEHALSAVADEPVSVTAAGRTDAGVHALGQVAHFDTRTRRDRRAWLLGANRHLPAAISLTWAREAPMDFHARRGALARTYYYLIVNRPMRSALHHARSWWVREDLDLRAMQTAAPLLLGEHDFTSFRSAECQSATARRELQALNIRRHGDYLLVECRANAFLHHMVRNIVGSLVRIGRGEQPPQWLRTAREARDRRAAGMTAPACGLYLTEVHYPAVQDIPPPRPFWLRDLR